MSEIKVYSTPTCPWCHKMKEYLNEHKIEFEDIDVSTDMKGREEMLSKSGQMGVPQIDINGKVIVGFNKDAIEAELAKLKEDDDSSSSDDDEGE